MVKKKLCKRVKDGQITDDINKYLNKVCNPKYVCLHCGRVANKQTLLCDPKLFTLKNK